ncbi:hypothetical protein CR51_27145 [Caballeronia megalochromosomata]|nr:hypothetical protein CR51_27145 [Caballeronia megalochromosomata]
MKAETLVSDDAIVRFEGRDYRLQAGEVYLLKLGKYGNPHWARAPHTYRRIIAVVRALHDAAFEAA